jgi:hypothetical protein
VAKTVRIKGKEGFGASSPNSGDEEKILKKLLGRVAKTRRDRN